MGLFSKTPKAACSCCGKMVKELNSAMRGGDKVGCGICGSKYTSDRIILGEAKGLKCPNVIRL